MNFYTDAACMQKSSGGDFPSGSCTMLGSSFVRATCTSGTKGKFESYARNNSRLSVATGCTGASAAPAWEFDCGAPGFVGGCGPVGQSGSARFYGKTSRCPCGGAAVARAVPLQFAFATYLDSACTRLISSDVYNDGACNSIPFASMTVRASATCASKGSLFTAIAVTTGTTCTDTSASHDGTLVGDCASAVGMCIPLRQVVVSGSPIYGKFNTCPCH